MQLLYPGFRLFFQKGPPLTLQGTAPNTPSTPLGPPPPRVGRPQPYKENPKLLFLSVPLPWPHSTLSSRRTRYSCHPTSVAQALSASLELHSLLVKHEHQPALQQYYSPTASQCHLHAFLALYTACTKLCRSKITCVKYIFLLWSHMLLPAPMPTITVTP